MLERLFVALLMLGLAVVAWLAARAGRPASAGLSAVLIMLSLLSLATACVALVWDA